MPFILPLIFVLFVVLPIFVLGIALVIFSFFTKSIPFRWVSVTSLFAYTFLVGFAGNHILTSEPEWNPNIQDDREVVGIWKDKDQKLELTSDHRFVFQNDDTTTSGIWDRDDWNLYLKTNPNTPDKSSTIFRFIEYKGHLRVLTHEMGDPDDWDGDIGLPKE